MAKKKNVPAIRFKGFDLAWEERTIESIYCYERPDNYIVKSVEYSDEYSTPVLTANKAFVLGYTNETRTFSKPSIIFDDFTLDFKYVDFPYMVKSSALKILTVKDDEIDNLIFTFNLLTYTKFEIMGHARHYISVVQPTNVKVPEIAEQTKIGAYFQSLDKQLSLHQAKLTKLTNLKKAMLEKMFPKNGAGVPEIRFNGFDGAWQKKRLGDLGKVKSGVGFPDIEQGGLTGTPFYKVSDMNNLGNEHEMKIANNYVSDEQITRKKWSPVTEIPAIIFAKVGAAIMLNRKRLVRSKFLIDNNTMAYIFDSSWDEEFGKSYFETINLPLYAQVGALPSYNASDIENIEVTISPKNAEQKAIGSFFKSLDKLITLHQTELEKLSNLKKATLEKMFV